MLAVFVELGREVGEIDVALVVAGNHDHLHAGEDGRGGVRAVGRRRDQTDVAVVVATAVVVGPDREEAGVLALASGIRLQRHAVVAGDLGQRVLEFGDELSIAGALVGGGERVDGGELGPADRFHLGGGVQLHRARAERDHRAVECEVAIAQLPEPPQHLVLGAELVEAAIGEERRRATHRRWDGWVVLFGCRLTDAVDPSRLDGACLLRRHA